MEHLSRITALRKLVLIVDDPDFRWTNVAELKKLLNLESLSVLGGVVDDDLVTEMAQIKSLGKLGLVRAKISGATLNSLVSLPQLKELDLLKSTVRDEHLGKLREMPALVHLGLDETTVSERGLMNLSGSKQPFLISAMQTRVSYAAAERFTAQNPHTVRCGVYHVSLGIRNFRGGKWAQTAGEQNLIELRPSR